MLTTRVRPSCILVSFLLLLIAALAPAGAAAQDPAFTVGSGDVDTPDPESVSPKTVRTPVRMPLDWSPAAVFSWSEQQVSSRLKKRTYQQDELGNRGTEFWLLFQRNFDDDYSRGEGSGIFIDVSSEFSTSGTVAIPGVGFSRDFTVEPGSVTRIQLPDTTRSTVTASVLTDAQPVAKGIHVTADDPIAVYGLDTFEQSSDGYLGLPTSILSTNYLVPSYTTSGFGDVRIASQVAVVSPRDGNTVTITPSAATASGRSAGESFDVTLDRGEAYQIRASGVGDDLTGSVIQSSLPVSVFSGSACANVPTDFPACDHLIEHVPPTETWGSQFVVAPLAGREAGETFRILAGNGGTEVTINGETVTTLGFGDYYETILDSSAVIETSNPALVTQYMNGQEFYEVNSGDPFMMLIPPTDQYGQQYSFSTPSEGFARNFISLTPPQSEIGTIELDGTLLESGFFQAVPNSNFAVGSDSVQLGTHTAQSTGDGRFGLYSYGDNAFDSYGFTGGLLLEFITEAGGPDIARTDATIALGDAGQAQGQPLTIAATITDDENPPVESASLFFRGEGASEYTVGEMTNVSGDRWEADIPSDRVQEPGIEYYILASNGRLQSTSPSVDPQGDPYSIAVLPNEPPSIDHVPAERAPVGEELLLEASVTDSTDRVASVELLYRSRGGNPAYTTLDMQGGDGTYSASIPGSEVTEPGLDYYIRATDNLGVSATEGTSDQPHTVTVDAPPGAPSGLQASVVQGQIEVTWDGVTDSDLAGYTVYRAPFSFGDVSQATALNDALSTETTFTDAEVTNGTTYYYRVTAVDEVGLESEPSNADSARVSASLPTATTDEVTDVTDVGAQFNGTVDPNGSETSVMFEYSATGSETVETVTAQESPIDGTESQSVEAHVSSLEPETEYTVQIVATNAAGTQRGATTSFTTSPFSISLSRSAETPEQGQPFTVAATVSSDFVPTEIAQVYYRRVGAESFQTAALDSVNETTYEAVVPGEAVTERGVEYYAALSNGEVSGTVPRTEPSSQPLYAPVRVPRMDAGVALEPDRYRMISVPLRLDTTNAFEQLRDDFGPLDRTVWRLLRWNPDAGDYDEVTTEDGTGDLVPGRAFWLITQSGETRDGQSTFDVTGGRSVSAEPIAINLPPGWSQVGNPRPYPVLWSSVGGHTSVMAPVSYDPSAPDSLNFSVEVLQPWAGYWVFNPESSSVQVSVPAPEAGTGQARGVAAADRSSERGRLFGDEPAYSLSVTARMEREGRAPLRDVHTEMGVADGAAPGIGVEDVAAPPPIGEYLRVSIVEEETRLAGSLRPPGRDGYEWDLEVSASGAERGVVHGELEAHGSLPAGFERRLMDPETGRRISLTDGRFTVQLTDEDPTRKLRLIVGTEDYAEAKSEAIRPDETALQAVYPNPARGNVSIDYQLKSARDVRIHVYDVLGRQVATLVANRRPAGHHTVQWDTQSGSTAVASGTYIVRMKTESTSVSQRVAIVR